MIRRLLRVDRASLVEFGLPVALEAAGLAFWAASMPVAAVATLGAGAAWQFVVLVRVRGRPTFLFHAVAATVLGGFAAGIAAGPRAATAVLPAGLACLLVGLGIAHRAAVRDRAARSLRRRRPDLDAPQAVWPRDRAAIALVLPTMLLAILLVPVATWRLPLGSAGAGDAAPDSSAGSSGANGAVPPPPQQPDRPPPKSGGSIPFPPGSAGTQQPDESADDEDGDTPAPHRRRPDTWKDRRVVMEVKPARDGKSLGPVGPIYLRGLPVAQTGFRWHVDVPPMRTIRDADDGRGDGWCELAVRPVPADRLELGVRQELPVAAPGGELVLFCPPGTSSISASRVRVEAGGVVVTNRTGSVNGTGGNEPFDYKLVALMPSRVPFPGQIARVVVQDTAAAPPASSDVAAARLAAMAQSVIQNVSSPVDRVQAVVRHLRDEFAYDESGAALEDPAALSKLLAAKRGSCTQFAQAGVVMLRAIGIPARVGTGFLANEWHAMNGAYVVRARDSHAWVEVAFEGCGWVIFDPTPREPAGAQDGRPEPGVSDPGAPDSPDATEDSAPPASEGDGLEEMVGGVRGRLRRILDWILANPWPCAAVAAAIAAVIIRAMRRRARRLSGERVVPASVRGPWEKLVTELARRGHRRRAAQTASEFAASVVASGGDVYRPLVALTARHEAARFGARPLSPDDEKAIDAFRAAIRGVTTAQRPG